MRCMFTLHADQCPLPKPQCCCCRPASRVTVGPGTSGSAAHSSSSATTAPRYGTQLLSCGVLTSCCKRAHALKPLLHSRERRLPPVNGGLLESQAGRCVSASAMGAGGTACHSGACPGSEWTGALRCAARLCVCCQTCPLHAARAPSASLAIKPWPQCRSTPAGASGSRGWCSGTPRCPTRPAAARWHPVPAGSSRC